MLSTCLARPVEVTDPVDIFMFNMDKPWVAWPSRNTIQCYYSHHQMCPCPWKDLPHATKSIRNVSPRVYGARAVYVGSHGVSVYTNCDFGHLKDCTTGSLVNNISGQVFHKSTYTCKNKDRTRSKDELPVSEEFQKITFPRARYRFPLEAENMPRSVLPEVLGKSSVFQRRLKLDLDLTECMLCVRATCRVNRIVALIEQRYGEYPARQVLDQIHPANTNSTRLTIKQVLSSLDLPDWPSKKLPFDMYKWQSFRMKKHRPSPTVLNA